MSKQPHMSCVNTRGEHGDPKFRPWGRQADNVRIWVFRPYEKKHNSQQQGLSHYRFC